MALLYSAPCYSLASASKLKLKNPNNLLSKTNSSTNVHLRGLPSYGNGNVYCSLIPKIVKTGVKIVEAPVVSLIDGLQPAIFTPPEGDLKKEDFPPDFLFGASTSALQVSLPLSFSISFKYDNLTWPPFITYC